MAFSTLVYWDRRFGEACARLQGNLFLGGRPEILHRRCSQQTLPNGWYLYTRLHGVTSQKS